MLSQRGDSESIFHNLQDGFRRMQIIRGDINGNDLKVRWNGSYDGMRSCYVKLFFTSLARFLFYKGLYMIVLFAYALSSACEQALFFFNLLSFSALLRILNHK